MYLYGVSRLVRGPYFPVLTLHLYLSWLPVTKPYESTLLKTLCQINVHQTCFKPAEEYQDVPDDSKQFSVDVNIHLNGNAVGFEEEGLMSDHCPSNERLFSSAEHWIIHS